jgi:hypothetical protein
MTRALDPLLQIMTSESSGNLHIVDIENLAGTGLLSAPGVKGIGDAYSKETHSGSNDLYLVAAGPQNKEALFRGWRNPRTVYQFRKGKDGADQALASLFNQIEHPEKFKRIYLASGDGGLVSIAERAADLGVELRVVTGRGATSWKYNAYEQIRISVQQ